MNCFFKLSALSVLLAGTTTFPPAHADTIAFTSFEEAPAINTEYTDLLDAGSDHELQTNAGEPIVRFTGTNELGFKSTYVNSRSDVGLTDGDFVGVTNYSGTVGNYTDGTQGFQFSDPDGRLILTLDTVNISQNPSAFLSMDYFLNETGWETNDSIKIWVDTNTGPLVLIDSIGTDIDSLNIEGAWTTLTAELSGRGWATLKIELDSNSSVESLFIDNIKFEDSALDSGNGEDNEDDEELSTATHTSFEEAVYVEGKYTDLDATTNHELLNNGGPTVSYEGGGELGFRSFFEKTGSSIGLSDGDFIGITTFTGAVGSFTDGSQGFQLSDTDGLVRVELDTIDLSLVPDNYNLLVDLFINSDGWETSDIVRIWVETDLETIDLINTAGSDIDELGIEGYWQTLQADLGAASTAKVKFSLVSGSASEAIYVDNIRFDHPPSLKSVTIMEIQGTGQISPLVGDRIQTRGIVTAISNDRKNFWIQDPTGDENLATSDAVYVFDADIVPTVGDLVSVTGSIAEYTSSSRSNDLPSTEIVGASVSIESSENRLPEATPIFDMPNESIPEAIEILESLEGMRITLKSAQVVSPTNNFGEFHVVTGNDLLQDSGFSPSYSQMLLRSIGVNKVDYNPELIMIDDLTLPEPLNVMPGDSFKGITGVLHYAFSGYRLMPTDIADLTINQAPTTLKRSSWWYAFIRSIRNRQYLNIASLNTENLFDLIDDPDKNDQSSTPTQEELDTKISKLAATIGIGLNFPDIVAVQEIENQTILQKLADYINRKMYGFVVYQAISIETSDRRGIETGFLYNARNVRLKDHYQLSDAIVPGVSDAFGPMATSPGREPLVATFKHRGQDITIVNNHFKSKGGDQGIYGLNQPAIRDSEIVRKTQAQVVRDFADTVLQANNNANLVILGDMNDFQFGEPGEGDNDPLSILRGDELSNPMTNLVDTQVPETSRFSYVYQGNSQVLDHFLVSEALKTKIKTADFVHINAAYLDEYMRDTSVLERSSDHDPILVKIATRPTRRNRR